MMLQRLFYRRVPISRTMPYGLTLYRLPNQTYCSNTAKTIDEANNIEGKSENTPVTIRCHRHDDYWMDHYQTLTKLFPFYAANVRVNCNCGEIRKYIRHCSKIKKRCPTQSPLSMQMVHIVKTGAPIPRLLPAKRKQRRVSKNTMKITNHDELMQQFQNLTSREATDKYNSEIQRRAQEGSTPKLIKVPTMVQWRAHYRLKTGNSEKPPIRNKRELKVPDWVQNDEVFEIKSDDSSKGKKYGDEYWKHHIKAIVTMFPGFLQRYENRTSHRDVLAYISAIKQQGKQCPARHSFFRKLEECLTVGGGKKAENPVSEIVDDLLQTKTQQ